MQVVSGLGREEVSSRAHTALRFIDRSHLCGDTPQRPEETTPSHVLHKELGEPGSRPPKPPALSGRKRCFRLPGLGRLLGGLPTQSTFYSQLENETKATNLNINESLDSRGLLRLLGFRFAPLRHHRFRTQCPEFLRVSLFRLPVPIITQHNSRGITHLKRYLLGVFDCRHAIATERMPQLIIMPLVGPMLVPK